MNETLQTLKNRCSTRQYLETQVPDTLLDSVLEAGIYAPSGMNNQKIYAVAVRDKQTRDLLSQLNAQVMNSDGDPFYGAPCVIVVLADPTVRTWVEDGSLMMGNLLNAAAALDLASCWIHRAKEVFDLPDGKALLQKWGLPAHLRGVGNCILGYAAATTERKPRLDGRILQID